jgi:hypothetical protein
MFLNDKNDFISKAKWSDKEIEKLVRSVYGEFDWVSVDEAKNAYERSAF